MSHQSSDPLMDTPEYHRQRVRAALATRVFVIFGAFVLLVVVIFQVFTIAQIRSTQKVSAANTHIIKDLAEQIKSCTTPAGQCAQRGTKQTGDAVDRISTHNLAFVVCADQPGQQSEEQIRKCAQGIIRRVENHGR